MMESLKPMLVLGGMSFEVKGELNERWSCFPAAVSYCCDILGLKYIFCKTFGTTVGKLCVRCMSNHGRHLEPVLCGEQTVEGKGRSQGEI